MRFLLTLILVLCLAPLSLAATDTEKNCKVGYATRFNEIDRTWLSSFEEASQQSQPTSSVIPYLISDFRSYYCDLQLVCQDVYNSLDTITPAPTKIIGCESRESSKINECLTNDPQIQAINVQACNNEIKIKKEIELKFLEAMVYRDYDHKKTGILVYRYQLITDKLHNIMFENVRLMFGYYTEFINRSKCYLSQCDLSPGVEP